MATAIANALRLDTVTPPRGGATRRYGPAAVASPTGRGTPLPARDAIRRRTDPPRAYRPESTRPIGVFFGVTPAFCGRGVRAGRGATARMRRAQPSRPP